LTWIRLAAVLCGEALAVRSPKVIVR